MLSLITSQRNKDEVDTFLDNFKANGQTKENAFFQDSLVRGAVKNFLADFFRKGGTPPPT